MQLHDVALRPAFSSPVSQPGRVFTYEGTPVRYVNTKVWRNALKRAGIAEFRWHGLRHTWASSLIQNGTPLYDLQEMRGWKSVAMVRRYAHLAPAHMARHAAVVDGCCVSQVRHNR
nr:tyrosine-type recombinase/integrase [Massilia aurea]